MLIDHQVLERIRAGEIDLVFRRWETARVKPGSQMRTSVGVLEVVSVGEIADADLTEDEAARAGFKSREDLIRFLGGRIGSIYRVQIFWVGPDPRIALREEIPDRAGIDSVAKRLDRLDRASSHGPWTMTTLELISAHPGIRAEDLAGMVGRDKKPFKLDVRKLKELGLTESLSVGYRISPRGEVVLTALSDQS